MNEEISALIDDEVAVTDVANAVSKMQSNEKAVESWSRYHLIGDVIRLNADKSVGVTGQSKYDVNSGARILLSTEFKQNLMSRLEQEPTVLAPNAAFKSLATANNPLQSMHPRKMPVIWSIAASFSAVMLVGWMALNQQIHNDSSAANVAQMSAEEQGIPQEYLVAHQATAPTTSSYYIQPASYTE